MRYSYEKPSIYLSKYGETYICNHPVYSRCTLYRMYGKGLAIVQQRFDPKTKHTYWTEIDPWLTDEIYLHEGFHEFFLKHADYETNKLFPTLSVRKVMWALKMKPLPKERWETTFDHPYI